MDELHLKVRGNKRYLFAMLDSDTRYWIAKMVAEHRGNDDVKPMFAQSKEIVGKGSSRKDGCYTSHLNYLFKHVDRTVR